MSREIAAKFVEGDDAMANGKTALIIGAGPAGLTAAHTLLKESNVHPVIVEMEDFVGGISRTMVHNGNRIDIGGHRFFSKNSDVTAFWQRLMPLQGKPSADDQMLGRDVPLAPGGPDPETEDRLFLSRTRVSRILYLRKFFDYPVSLKLQTVLNLGFRRTFQAGFGYLVSACRKRTETSLEDFLINRFGAPLYRMFFMDYTEKVWGRSPKDISADWGAQRIRGLSLMKTVATALAKTFRKKSDGRKDVETSLIERFAYPKKGPGQLWETLADEVTELGGELKLRAEVKGIHLEDGKIRSVTVRTDGGLETIEADWVFSSMPVSELVAAFDCAVPQDVYETAQSLPYRDFITVGLLVRGLKIKNTTKFKTVSDVVPDCWIYVQEPEVKMGRIQIFNNWSPYMVRDPVNTVWIGLEYFCNEGDELWEMTDEDFIAFAIGELAGMDLADREDVLDAVRIKVKKAYPAYFGSYEQFDLVRDYLNSVENLYCIGRNGQHRYNNMDHSMLTAMQAVQSLVSGTPKDAVWSVNTEAKYHEKQG